MNRRIWLQSAGGALLGGTMPVACTTSGLSWRGREAGVEELNKLEKHSGGRLGVAALDCATGRWLEWRAKERFAMCSTFKFLLAAGILAKADTGKLTLETEVLVPDKNRLVPYSPVTEKKTGRRMSVSDLCEATMTWSDNTAANLLLPLIGGPEGLTSFVRGLGDQVTRLDRTEPELNTAIPGDERDTTAPFSMVNNMRHLLLGDRLACSSKERLQAWMKDSQTGFNRLRAGLPADVLTGDKTGTGSHTANDIAIVWLPDSSRGPWLISCYLTEHHLEPAATDALHAKVAQVVSQSFG